MIKSLNKRSFVENKKKGRLPNPQLRLRLKGQCYHTTFAKREGPRHPSLIITSCSVSRRPVVAGDKIIEGSKNKRPHATDLNRDNHKIKELTGNCKFRKKAD